MTNTTSVDAKWLGWLAFAREVRGCDLAAKWGVSPSAVSNWRKGNATPSPANREKIRAEVGDITVGQYADGPRTDVDAVLRLHVRRSDGEVNSEG
jgi:transcriptional regulator with XRE-family HTH domain